MWIKSEKPENASETQVNISVNLKPLIPISQFFYVEKLSPLQGLGG